MPSVASTGLERGLHWQLHWPARHIEFLNNAAARIVTADTRPTGRLLAQDHNHATDVSEFRDEKNDHVPVRRFVALRTLGCRTRDVAGVLENSAPPVTILPTQLSECVSRTLVTEGLSASPCCNGHGVSRSG